MVAAKGLIERLGGIEGVDEEFIKRISKPLPAIPGIKHRSRFEEDFPIELILKIAGLWNYRTHTIPGTENLGFSMEEEGQLEPVSITLDSSTGEGKLVDGEGRIQGARLRGAISLPTEIYYDLSVEEILRMKTSANAGKEGVDATDMAVFSGSLQSMMSLNHEGREVRARDIGRLLGRGESTVRGYGIFASMSPRVVEYVSTHRQNHLLRRAIRVAQAIPDDTKTQERVFFSILENGRSEEITSSLFERSLQARLEEVSGEGFRLRTNEEKTRDGQERLNQLFDLVRTARRYIDAFTLFIDTFPNVKSALYSHKFGFGEENILDYLGELRGKFENSLAYMSEPILARVEKSLESPGQTGFRERVDARVARRDGSEKIRIHSVGKEIKYIPEEQIRNRSIGIRDYALGERGRKVLRALSSRSQVLALFEDQGSKGVDLDELETLCTIDRSGRVRYVLDRNDRVVKEGIVIFGGHENLLREIKERAKHNSLLDKEINVDGQIKPGLIKRVGSNEYRLVCGQRRLDSVRRNGIPYFKTFVRDEMSELEGAIFQCIENLYEADTPAERANVLYTQYQLRKMLAAEKGEDYSVKDFVRDFGHLASDSTLTRAIRFMEQDEIIQRLVRSRIVSFGSSFKISSVPEEKRFEVLFAAMVLSNKQLEQRIREINGSDGQMDIFNGSIPISYRRIFAQFESHTSSPFSYLKAAMEQCGDSLAETISGNQYLFMHYAELYRGICQLEDILKEK